MRISIILFLALLVISACSNWKEEPAISKVIFINALPGSGEATLLFDGQPLNAEPLVYDAFTTTYRDIRAGRRIGSVNFSGNAEPVEIGTFYIPEFENFTAFITKDTTDKSEEGRFYFYQDVLTEPASGKANVRFMNLYPDKNAKLDLLISSQTDTLFSQTDTLFKNQNFGNITSFVPIDTFSKYVFTLNLNGDLVSGLNDTISLSRQNSYTILVTDESGSGTGVRKPKLQRITHQ